MKLPGIRVDREAFLREQFKDEDPVAMNTILAVGPVAAGYDRDRLRRKADGVILATTLMSTGASFLAGLPGGLALAVTIPTDLLQYYGAALKMAQEIAYLYGEPDLWKGSLPDDEAVTNQLILYIGVMLGATGAAPAVRLSASAFEQRLLKRRPQNPSTDTYTYPVVKSVLRFFAKTITKTSLAKGVTKVIPVIGGLVSGGITFASLKPMAARLQQTLDKAHFSYSDVDIANDIAAVEEETARGGRGGIGADGRGGRRDGTGKAAGRNSGTGRGTGARGAGPDRARDRLRRDPEGQGTAGRRDHRRTGVRGHQGPDHYRQVNRMQNRRPPGACFLP